MFVFEATDCSSCFSAVELDEDPADKCDEYDNLAAAQFQTQIGKTYCIFCLLVLSTAEID